jgi:hypothetical protein
MPVPRSGNTQGASLGNRFTQKVKQRIVDTGVFDASGSEQQFHDFSPCRFTKQSQNLTTAFIILQNLGTEFIVLQNLVTENLERQEFSVQNFQIRN